MKRCLVVIPTYNEAENLPQLLPIVLKLGDHFNILIVDDGSPDGSGKLVKEMQKTEPRLHLIERPGKMGLGTAYVAGFKYAIANGFDFVFEMDADFSHDPARAPRMLEKAEEYDLVIGSRYIQGVNVVNWPMRRLLLSYFANIYTRVITGMPCASTPPVDINVSDESAREHRSRSDSFERLCFPDRDELQDMAKGIPHLRDSHRFRRPADRRIEDVKTYRLRSRVDGMEAQNQEFV